MAGCSLTGFLLDAQRSSRISLAAVVEVSLKEQSLRLAAFGLLLRLDLDQSSSIWALCRPGLIRGVGEGLAFLKNPVLENAPPRVRLENLSGDGTLSGQYAKVYSSVGALVALLTGQTPSEIFGQYARPDGNGDFIFAPSADPRFEEAQLYHNLDRVHARFKALGFGGLERALEGVVYDLDAIEQGPFFSPLAFEGRGGVFFGPLPPRFEDPTRDADAPDSRMRDRE